MLQELGSYFFVRDNRGRGLLHVAAAGDALRFQQLLDSRLDPMLEDDMQQTALDVAAACPNDDFIQIFENMVKK